MNATPATPDPRGALLYRLRFTPLRDVVRGRLTARLDWRRVIDDAQLPAPLAELTRRVVARTRLTRLEQADVARELVAHFQDGREAGRTAAELRDTFGDERTAARLIRRAKRRARPAVAQTARGALLLSAGALAALVLVYVCLAIRLHVGQPNITRNYSAELNAAAAAVPEADRAWPLYRVAAIQRTAWPDALDFGDAPPLTQLADPEHAAWLATATEFVAANRGAIELIHKATQRPALGAILSAQPDLALHRKVPEGRGDAVDAVAPTVAEPDPNPLLIELQLPQATVLRDAARLLYLDLLVALETDARDLVRPTLVGQLRIADHLAEIDGILLTEIVAVDIVNLAGRALRELIAAHPDALSDADIVDLAHRLAGARGGGPLRIDIAQELAFYDAVQRIYTDDGDGDGHLTEAGLELLQSIGGPPWHATALGTIARPVLATRIAGRAEMVARYEDLLESELASERLPLWQRRTSRAYHELAAAHDAKSMQYLLVDALLPSLERLMTYTELATQRRDAALVMLAAERFRREHDRWPERLDELTPRYLPAVPPDRFDGQPLRYRLVDGRPLLYSVGADRDDDHGRPPPGRHGHERAREWVPLDALDDPVNRLDPDWLETHDGDWILWPPVRER